MSQSLQEFLSRELNNLEAAGLLQLGLPLASPQGPHVKIGTKELINFASDNYLGWANDPRLREAALKSTEELGSSWSSSRSLSGTHKTHRKLEEKISQFLTTEDTLVFSSHYLANTGIFESLFGEQDYLFCDFSLHPSMVDGIRMSASRYLIFKSNDLADLEDKLKRSPQARFRAIVVESVSPQEGVLAPLVGIMELAKKYEAILIVDDSNGLGVLGATGRGIAEETGMVGKIDLLVSSLTHSIGAAGGALVSGKREIVAWLRQKSRTYLFAESPSPAVIGSALCGFEILSAGCEEIANLKDNTIRFRQGLTEAGFEVIPAEHPIVSIVIGDALLAQRMTNRLYQKGIFVMGFSYPVTPRGSARIRVQISSAHLKKDIAEAIAAFKDVGHGLRII